MSARSSSQRRNSARLVLRWLGVGALAITSACSASRTDAPPQPHAHAPATRNTGGAPGASRHAKAIARTRISPSTPRRTLVGHLVERTDTHPAKSILAYHGHRFFLETADGKEAALLPTLAVREDVLADLVGARVELFVWWYKGEKPLAQAPIDPVTGRAEWRGEGWRVLRIARRSAAP